MNSFRTFAFLATFAFIALPSAADADTCPYQEQNGQVVIEVEAEPPNGGWTKKTNVSGYSGSGFYEWTGANSFGTAGNGTLTYKVKINSPGKYQFLFRSRINKGEDGTEHNDSWVRMSGTPISGEYSIGKNKWVKAFMAFRRWVWETKTNDHNAKPIRQYFTAGTHTIEISGRSNGHAIDKFILFKYEDKPYLDGGLPYSPKGEQDGNLNNQKNSSCSGGDGTTTTTKPTTTTTKPTTTTTKPTTTTTKPTTTTTKPTTTTTKPTTTTTSGPTTTTTLPPGAKVAIDNNSITAACDATDSRTLKIPNVPVGAQADRILVVAVSAEDSSSDCDLAKATVTYGGMSMTRAASALSDTGSWRACNGIFYLLSPPTGTADVVATFANVKGAPTPTRTGGAWVIFNAVQSAPEATATDGEEPSSPAGFETNITTASINALVLDVISEGNTGNFTPDAGQQLLWQRGTCEDTAGAASSAKQGGLGGTTTMGWTHSNPKRVAQTVVAFAPVPAPPTTTTSSTTTTTLTGSGTVKVDTTSVVSTCKAVPGGTVVIPDVAVGSMPNQVLVVSVGAEDSRADCDLSLPAATAFYGGQKMTLAASSVSDMDSWRACNGIFYLLNPPTGMADVTVTFRKTGSNKIDNRHAGAMVLYDAAQAAPGPVSTDGAETGADAAAPLGIGPVTEGAMLVDVYTDGNLGTLAPTQTDQVERWEQGCASSVSATSTRSVLSSGANRDLGWTHSNPKRYAHSAVQFTPAP